MNIHEYQAKEILRKFNVATLKGKVATRRRSCSRQQKILVGLRFGLLRLKFMLADAVKVAE
jgi:succinyl-CoA synthetase beta subunit